MFPTLEQVHGTFDPCAIFGGGPDDIDEGAELPKATNPGCYDPDLCF